MITKCILASIRKNGGTISLVAMKAFISDFRIKLLCHLDNTVDHRFIFVLLYKKNTIFLYIDIEIGTVQQYLEVGKLVTFSINRCKLF